MDIKIIAHRGIFDNNKIIENTIPSFKEAIRLHYPIELDVQLTKDNQLVVFHDDNLVRLAGRNGVIQNMSYEALKDIPLGDKNCIPLFSEVLKLNQDKVLIDIEIKPTKRKKETISYLKKELEGYHNYIIKSFDPRIMRKVKKEFPTIQTGLLIHDHYDNKIIEKIMHSSFILKYAKCSFVAISKKLLKNDKMMKKYSNYRVFVWTIKEKKEVNYQDNITYLCNNLPYKK